jgi:hypothetical protein
MSRARFNSSWWLRGGPRRLAALAAIALASLGGASPGSGQSASDEVVFLLLPTGARVVAVGRAGATLRGDLQSLRWNPAVLSAVTGVTLLASHYDGPLDFVVNDLAAGFSIGTLGKVAISLDVQDFGEIELSPESPSDGTGGTVTPSNLVLGFSYSTALFKGVAAGITAKWVRSELFADAKGSTFALDVGLLCEPAASVPLSIGLSTLNIGPGLQLGEDAEADPLPSRLRFGVSYDVLRQIEPEGRVRLLIAVDFEQMLRDLDTGSQYLGVELGLADIFFVRGGYISEELVQDRNGFTVGFGLGWSGFRFDLAREMGVNELGDETHVSVSAQM